jgi:hypothetical protein
MVNAVQHRFYIKGLTYLIDSAHPDKASAIKKANRISSSRSNKQIPIARHALVKRSKTTKGFWLVLKEEPFVYFQNFS